jgi:hypothetical protein
MLVNGVSQHLFKRSIQLQSIHPPLSIWHAKNLCKNVLKDSTELHIAVGRFLMKKLFGMRVTME